MERLKALCCVSLTTGEAVKKLTSVHFQKHTLLCVGQLIEKLIDKYSDTPRSFQRTTHTKPVAVIVVGEVFQQIYKLGVPVQNKSNDFIKKI